MSKDRKLGLIVTMIALSSMFFLIWAVNLFAKVFQVL